MRTGMKTGAWGGVEQNGFGRGGFGKGMGGPVDASFEQETTVTVTDAVQHAASDVRDISIYAIPPEHAAAPDKDHPILLSYVDAVLQGYLREFGEAGAERFCATTEGWNTPVLNDRAAPVYPRAQRLTMVEQTFVDDMLLTLRAKVFD